MIETLYPIFQKWSKRGSVYICSDLHLDDEDRCLMGYNISEQEQIDIIKKTCHKNDTLVCLGDVGNPEYISQINSYKVLIMGNHDTGANKYKEKTAMIDLDQYSEEEIDKMEKAKIVDYVSCEFHKPFVRGYKSNNLFDEVYKGPLMISDKIILSHEPVYLTAYITGNPIAFNIHGHDHSGTYIDDYHLNCTANIVGFQLINLNDIIKKGLISNIKGIHREIIEKAKEKTS